MKYKLHYEFDREIEADSEEDAVDKMAERIDLNNETVETLFWDEIEVKPVTREQATRINEEGYVARPVGSKGKGGRRKIIYKDWWLGKQHLHIHVNTLPQRYWGKHIKIKIEVEND